MLTRSWSFWTKEPTDTDAPLLEKARRGSLSAFDTLRHLHEQPLLGFIYRRVGAGSADDIAQDVWLACWAGLPQYSGRSRFKTWLYGIAAHKCTDHLRMRYQDDRREEAAVFLETQRPNEHHAVELKESIRAALSHLPEPQREVLELYYYAELTLAEVAKALGRNVNTVKYQFYQAHTRVAQELKNEKSGNEEAALP